MATHPENAGAAVLVIVCLFASSFLLALLVWKMISFVARSRARTIVEQEGPAPAMRLSGDMIGVCEYCGRAREPDGHRCSTCGAHPMPETNDYQRMVGADSRRRHPRIGGTGQTSDLRYRSGQ